MTHGTIPIPFQEMIVSKDPAKVGAASMDLFDPEVQAEPWDTYKQMREQGAVYVDPKTGYFIVTRYQELRDLLENDELFNTRHPEGLGKPWLQTELGQRVLAAWEETGWAPRTHLQEYTGTEHAQIRSTMNWAFTGARVKEAEEMAGGIVRELIDGFFDRGQCEWVSEFATLLPLRVIGNITGIDKSYLPMILKGVDAYTSIVGLMDDEQKAFENLELIVSCQKAIHKLIEGYRIEPDESLLSYMANVEIPGQGRKFDDHELHSHIFSAFYVAGAETTRNTLSEMMRILIERPDMWARLKAEGSNFIKPFIEEVLRISSPTQGLFKFAQRDAVIDGVEIPKGSMIITRYGSANHDERHFERPEEFDPGRPALRSHLAFGAGAHMCIGQHLARAELRQALLEFSARVKSVSFTEGRNDFAYHPNFALRGLKELHISFVPE